MPPPAISTGPQSSQPALAPAPTPARAPSPGVGPIPGSLTPTGLPSAAPVAAGSVLVSVRFQVSLSNISAASLESDAKVDLPPVMT